MQMYSILVLCINIQQMCIMVVHLQETISEVKLCHGL